MKVIKRGGKDITKSISQSLSISFEYAEELKKRFGCEHSNSGARQEIVLKRDEATFKTIDKSVITAAASQAACNVFENIYSIFKDSPVFEQNSSKVVLTGATALMDSMIEILQSKFNLTLEVGNPRGFKIDNQLNSPSWSTCLGVVKKTFLGACTHPSSRALSLHKYLVQKLSDFMTDYF
jgi:cell division ATPase FtsA